MSAIGQLIFFAHGNFHCSEADVRQSSLSTQSDNSTIKLCGVSEAQRSERPNERIVMRFEMHLIKMALGWAAPFNHWPNLFL